jgi:hypothetical protein
MLQVKTVLGLVVFLTLGLAQAYGGLLFSDGFETYNPGALDANLSGGPNQAPNGGPGNPWFGPAPPNVQVVGPGGGLSSGTTGTHSGSQMVSGHFANDFDQNWLNIANRFGGGANIQGGIDLDWWFYDPAGAGNTNFSDYVALGNYSVAGSAAASGLDYTAASGGNLNTGGASQRLSLGAANVTGGDPNFYQARVVGATDGLGGGQWFNLPMARSVGWHEGSIVLGAPNGAATDVQFYIDGQLQLDHAIDTTGGVNVIELNAAFNNLSANYDDITLSTVAVPEPATAGLALFGVLCLLALRRRG